VQSTTQMLRAFSANPLGYFFLSDSQTKICEFVQPALVSWPSPHTQCIRYAPITCSAYLCFRVYPDVSQGYRTSVCRRYSSALCVGYGFRSTVVCSLFGSYFHAQSGTATIMTMMTNIQRTKMALKWRKRMKCACFPFESQSVPLLSCLFRCVHHRLARSSAYI
jgi:hypothetical protein